MLSCSEGGPPILEFTERANRFWVLLSLLLRLARDMTKGRVKNRARIGGQNFAELPVLAEVWSGSLIWPLKEPPKIEWPSKKLKNVMTIFFFQEIPLHFPSLARSLYFIKNDNARRKWRRSIIFNTSAKNCKSKKTQNLHLETPFVFLCPIHLVDFFF